MNTEDSLLGTDDIAGTPYSGVGLLVFCFWYSSWESWCCSLLPRKYSPSFWSAAHWSVGEKLPGLPSPSDQIPWLFLKEGPVGWAKLWKVRRHLKDYVIGLLLHTGGNRPSLWAAGSELEPCSCAPSSSPLQSSWASGSSLSAKEGWRGVLGCSREWGRGSPHWSVGLSGDLWF